LRRLAASRVLSAPAQGVTLAVIPFGASQVPYFDGALGSFLTIDDDPQYSQPYAKRFDRRDLDLSVGARQREHYRNEGSIRPFRREGDRAVDRCGMGVAALQSNQSHAAFAAFLLHLQSGLACGRGERLLYGVWSFSNDKTPIELGKWVFVAGEAEPWISPTDQTTGCILWKQAAEAKRVAADKCFEYKVHLQHGSGPITVGGTQTTGLKGAIARLAL
jgi:hypothetical protein